MGLVGAVCGVRCLGVFHDGMVWKLGAFATNHANCGYLPTPTLFLGTKNHRVRPWHSCRAAVAVLLPVPVFRMNGEADVLDAEDADGVVCCEFFDSPFAVEPAQTGVAFAAERDVSLVLHRHFVDVSHARFDR